MREIDEERVKAASILLPPGELIDAVANRFSIDEINELAHGVGLEPENLTGERRIDRAHSLVATMHRQGRLPELMGVLREERPYIEWPEGETKK